MGCYNGPIEMSDSPVLPQSYEARIAELSARVAELEQEKAALLRRQMLLQLALDALPCTLFVKDRDLRYVVCNQAFARDSGLAKADDIVGKNDYQLASTREQADGFRADDVAVMDSGQAKLHIIERLRLPDGHDAWVETNKVPLCDEDGQVVGVMGTYENITARKQAEAEMSQRREELISVVAELSTPLLPIHERVLVMPLIGHFDEERARRAMERLLDGIVQYQAEVVILDMTGVPAVDVEVATGIGNVVRAADLLGTRVILTGLAPKLAKAIVEVGLDLGRVTTRATLRDGVAIATRSAAAQGSMKGR